VCSTACVQQLIKRISGVLGQVFFRYSFSTSLLHAHLSQADYPNVNWVPKARWVVDGHIWTSSGVTAGSDMAYAFLEHLVGHEVANAIRGVVEVSVRKQDDDEFAEFYGLV
jgi:transcriptional regulator GlxA family with amidase domain